MQVVMLVVSLLAAAILLIFLIVILGLWMKGVTTILLPGLGVMFSTAFLFVILLCAEIIMVLVAVYAARHLK